MARLQEYATKAGDTIHQGDGNSGTGWNYYDQCYATTPNEPWEVGSGSQELNGTYDMMGNVWEWMESNYDESFEPLLSRRAMRGGPYGWFSGPAYCLTSTSRVGSEPYAAFYYAGFRVAANVPEPASISLIVLGGLALLRQSRRQA